NTADDNGDTMMNKLLGLDFEYFRNHEEALRKIVTSVKLGDNLNLHKKFGKEKGFLSKCNPLALGVPPVLCHGDLWVNNIFFKKDQSGIITDEVYAFLDWQLAHPNTGLTDICHLLLLGVNAELKLRYTDYWLRLYFDTFEQ
ncbi:calcium/calmodulin-dependent protein kinase type 1, partial [Aphelenchoides avenae]